MNPIAKSVYEPKFHKVDAALMASFNRYRRAGFNVTREMLRVQAQKTREALLKGDTLSVSERAKFESFKVSSKYVRLFVKWNDLKSTRLHGEVGSVDRASKAAAMDRVREITSHYDPEYIFNMDETGLFFRQLPKTSYVEPGEKKTVRGVKGMKAKDRITVIVATNATGYFKIPLSVIGKAKKPKCFRVRCCPLHYQAQPNAWADGARFAVWFQDCFLPAIRKFTSEKVLLLMDNAGSHDSNTVDPRGQVRIECFPPNCTSVHQPMDMGIIASIKVKYRYALLSKSADLF